MDNRLHWNHHGAQSTLHWDPLRGRLCDQTTLGLGLRETDKKKEKKKEKESYHNICKLNIFHMGIIIIMLFPPSSSSSSSSSHANAKTELELLVTFCEFRSPSLQRDLLYFFCAMTRARRDIFAMPTYSTYLDRAVVYMCVCVHTVGTFSCNQTFISQSYRKLGTVSNHVPIDFISAGCPGGGCLPTYILRIVPTPPTHSQLAIQLWTYSSPTRAKTFELTYLPACMHARHELRDATRLSSEVYHIYMYHIIYIHTYYCGVEYSPEKLVAH